MQSERLRDLSRTTHFMTLNRTCLCFFFFFEKKIFFISDLEGISAGVLFL